MRARIGIVLATTLFSLSGIAALIWLQDLQYTLPTPRPSGLIQPAQGEQLALETLGVKRDPGKPLFLHFFNPGCPCSRFNVDHVRELIRLHRSKVQFVAVLQGEGDGRKLRGDFESLGLGIESIVDESGEIGRLCGVYATPQAVLVDRNGALYYRGNYNISRYCTLPKTAFARVALDAMLAGRPPLPIPEQASIAYGCPRKAHASANQKL